MSGRRLAGALVAATLFGLVAGCGKSGTSGPSSPPSPAATPTPTPTPAATPGATPSATPPAPAAPGSPGTTCAPATCAGLGKDCGAVSDGCGGNLFCGSCLTGQVCGAGGANVCGAPATGCTPTTCASAKASCGSVPDGCGGTLSCGSCPAGQSCGGGGTANACGAPKAAGGATRWVQWIGGPDRESVFRIRADAKGNLAVLALRTTSAGDSTLVVQKRTADGSVTWGRTFAASAGAYVSPWGLAASGGGSVFFSVAQWCQPAPCPGMDFGGGATNAALVKLASDGTFEWQKTDLPWGGVVVADASGDVAAQRWDPAKGMVVDLLDSGGTTRWTAALNGARPLAFAPDGSLYVGWYSTSDYKPRLTRLDASGKEVWTRTTAQGTTALATSARGTPVSLEWSELAVYEAADGTERFRVTLPLYGADLAVQPGLADVIAAVVVGQDSAGCNAMAVRRYDLAGDFLWSRHYDAEGSCGGAPLAGGVVVEEDGEIVVGGTATVPTDLGQGTYTPAGPSDGFLLDLAP